jgi:hypothetical protein
MLNTVLAHLKGFDCRPVGAAKWVGIGRGPLVRTTPQSRVPQSYIDVEIAIVGTSDALKDQSRAAAIILDCAEFLLSPHGLITLRPHKAPGGGLGRRGCGRAGRIARTGRPPPSARDAIARPYRAAPSRSGVRGDRDGRRWKAAIRDRRRARCRGGRARKSDRFRRSTARSPSAKSERPGHNLMGIYAEITEGGDIAVGDPLAVRG